MKKFSTRKLQQLKDLIHQIKYPEEFITEERNNYSVLDEKYLNLGDYILVFPNPDHEDYEYKNNCIQFQDALRDFDKMYDVDCAFPQINEQEEIYRIAFINVFNSLCDPPPEYTEMDEGFMGQGQQKGQKLFIVDEKGEQIRIKPDTTKCMGQGNFLFFNVQTNHWERTGNPVSDVSTLIRIFTIQKLTIHGGFFIRQFLSIDSKSIFVVLFQELRNLQIEAERIGLKKRVNISYCDILSLEPVDIGFRPLRFNKVITSPQEQLTLEQREYQKKIRKLLRLVDYNKLARECNQQPYEVIGEIQEQRQVNGNEWKAYIFYLQTLVVELENSRKKYQELSYTKILNNQELKSLLENFKEQSYKSKSQKQYVKEQSKSKELESNKRKIKVFLKRKKAKEIFDIMLKAKHQTDKLFGKVIFNLWDRIGQEPQGPFIEYFQPRKNQSFNSFIKQNSIWTQLVINEKGQISLFNKMERAKLNTSIIKQLINLEYVITKEYILEYFIPNSYFDLDGQKYKDDHYVPLKQAGKLNQDILFSIKLVKTISQKIKQYVDQNNVQKDNTKVEGGLDGQNLLNLWGLFDVPVKYIGEYYGERVALYFKFLQYFVQELLAISYFGIVTFIVQLLYDVDQLANKMAIIFFTIMIVFWSSTFQSLWRNQEMHFQTMFGLEEAEVDDVELVGFIGKPKRSIATDKLNELQYSSKSTWFKIFFNLLLVGIFIVVEIIIIVALQGLTLYLENNPSIPQISFIELSVFIPALIWVFIGIILDNIYRPFAFFLTKWENHKMLSQFETSFIIKNLLFSTVNRLGQPFIISFFYQNTIGCVNDNYCYSQLQIYMRVVFIIEFGKHILFGFIFPIIKQALLKARLGFVTIVDFGDSLQKKSPYYNFNKVLENEIQKDSYTIDQVDGTIWEYLELNLQYALLACFGSPFPLIFVTGLAMNCFELVLDKFKLIWLTKRPIPQTKRSIGPFVYYMNLISYISIFINSALLSYTNEDVFTDFESFTLFIILLICFFLFKFVTDTIYSNTDNSADQVRQRHKQIKRKLNVEISNKPLGNKTISYPIMKIYGTLLPHQANQN